MPNQKQYSVYDIKKEDTLESIVAFFEKSKQEIVGFHNIYAKQDDLIGMELPSHLQHLFLYPNLHFKATGVAKHLNENYLHHHYHKIINKFRVQYLCIEGEQKTHVEFDISLQNRGVFKEGHIYEIHKISATEINGDDDLNDIENVKELLLNLIYPIQVLVRENGTWQELLYDKRIVKRFEIAKKHILEFNNGQLVDDLLDHAEKNLSNETKFKELFEDNWLLDAIFSNVYRYYNNNEATEEALHFALLKGVPPQKFMVLQMISNFDGDKKLVTICKKGTLNDERTRAQFEQLVEEQNFDGQGETFATGDLEQNIVLNVETFALESVHLKASLDLQEKRVVEIVLTPALSKGEGAETGKEL
jgi:hypothetical protein